MTTAERAARHRQVGAGRDEAPVRTCKPSLPPPGALNNGIFRVAVTAARWRGKAWGDSQQLTESVAPVRKGSSRVFSLGKRKVLITTSINPPVDLPSVSFLCY